MIKHISFDVAGTLYKENHGFLEARNDLIYSSLSDIIGEKNLDKVKHTYDELYHKSGSNSAVFHSLGKPWSFWHGILENIDPGQYLEPDREINKYLKIISKHASLSAFSTFPKKRIIQLLEKLEMPISLFLFILGGDDVSARKPHLDGFYRIIELANVPARQIMYVGDRLETDIRPAKEAGLRTCLIWQKSSEADYSVKDFSELGELINKLTIS